MLRMRGAIAPLPQYIFMVWCLVEHMTTLPYNKLGVEMREETVVAYFKMLSHHYPRRNKGNPLNSKLQYQQPSPGLGPERPRWAHPASYPVGTGGSFPGYKAAGA
jgi:hypothetical protein